MNAPARPLYCRHEGASRMVRTQTASGMWRVTKQCRECRQTFGPSFTKPVDWEALPVVDNGYRTPDNRAAPCVVNGCTEAFTEYHHWLPRGIAGPAGEVADEWPGGYLCRKHHMRWHGLVTPGLVAEADQLVKEKK